MTSYLYLFLDLISLSFPLFATFDQRIAYYKNLKSLLLSIFIVGLVFILWDALFTKWGVWGFNSKYLLGPTLFDLPLEEHLFFFCIPYASVFIYEALKYFKKGYVSSFKSLPVSIVLSSLLILFAAFYWDRSYTVTTFISLALVILLLEFIIRPKWLSHFYIAYLWVLIPFFIINGILTGTFISEQIVWYNAKEIMGLRLGTIPVEDAFYGMLLILSNVSLFEYFKMRNYGKNQF